MTDREGTAHENLLEILDNVIRQVDFTKKMVIIMIVSFITVIPVSAVVINAVSGDPGAAIPAIAVTVFVIWLGVGIRQWVVLSRWSRKYRRYRELQKKLDERLDFEKDEQKGQ